MSKDASGNAAADAGLTEESGTPENGTDLTEVVRGLSRQITSLKTELASAAAKPKPEVEEELSGLREQVSKYETLEKYADVAPILAPLLKKKGFDASIVDDEFVAALRAARGDSQGDEDEETVQPMNPVRRGGALTQEQRDEQTLKGMTSLFDN